MMSLERSLQMISELNNKDTAVAFHRILRDVVIAIRDHPYEDKYRHIIVGTPFFQEKIASVRGYRKVFDAIGFRRRNTDGKCVRMELVPSSGLYNIMQNHLNVVQRSLQTAQHGPGRRVEARSGGARRPYLFNRDHDGIDHGSGDEDDLKHSPAPNRRVQGMLRHLTMMGFSTKLAIDALRRSNNDLNIAAEMLLSGSSADGSSEPDVPVRASAPSWHSGNAAGSSHYYQGFGGAHPSHASDEEATQRLLFQIQQEDILAANERARQIRLDEAAAQRILDEDNALTREVDADIQAAQSLVDNDLMFECLERELREGNRLTTTQRNALILHRKSPESDIPEQFECSVCMDDRFLIKDIVVLECSHYLCSECMKHYIAAEVDGGKLSNLKCFDVECGSILSVADIDMGATWAVSQRYQRLMTQKHLESDPNVRWCPAKNCTSPMIGSDGCAMMVCPECHYRFCFNCETEEWHDGISCTQYQQWKRENDNGDNTFEQWKIGNSKPCPACHSAIQKNGGCDHMTCRCGYQFYWSTGARYP